MLYNIGNRDGGVLWLLCSTALARSSWFTKQFISHTPKAKDTCSTGAIGSARLHYPAIWGP